VKVYKHYHPRSDRLLLLFLGVLGLAGVGGLAWLVAAAPRGAPPFPVFLALLVIAAINFWILGGVVKEIRLEDEGYVELVAPLRTTRVSVPDILSIAPSEAMQGKVFVLKHRDGKVRFDPKLDGMHELIGELKRRNPGITLRGI
jgi:hypothetical protein